MVSVCLYSATPKLAETPSPCAIRCHGVETICCLIRSTDIFGLHLGNLWINDEHLVTTVSDTRILLADDVLNDVGNRFENLITDLMSKSVVDRFELV